MAAWGIWCVFHVLLHLFLVEMHYVLQIPVDTWVVGSCFVLFLMYFQLWICVMYEPLLCHIGGMLLFAMCILRSLVCQDWRDTLVCYMSAMVILIGVFLYVWEFCSRTSLKEVKPLLREGNFSLYVIGKHIHVHLLLTTHNAAAYTILTPRPGDVVPPGRTPSSNAVFLWLLILFIYVPLIYSYNCSFQFFNVLSKCNSIYQLN